MKELAKVEEERRKENAVAAQRLRQVGVASRQEGQSAGTERSTHKQESDEAEKFHHCS